MLIRDAFAADYDCIPEATGTARITFQSLVRTSLAIDFEDTNSGVQQEPEIVHWLLAVGLKPAAFNGRSCILDLGWTGETILLNKGVRGAKRKGGNRTAKPSDPVFQ